MYRVRGVIMSADGTDPQAGAANLDRAIDVARRQNARFLELRAAVSRARLHIDQGLPQNARDLLAPVFASFSEGFDTADLREARSLLSEVDRM